MIFIHQPIFHTVTVFVDCVPVAMCPFLTPPLSRMGGSPGD